MAYSSKSNVIQFNIRDEKTGEIIREMVLQADKLDRICEMYPRYGNLLEKYRGKQINDDRVLESIYNELFNL
jgi:hypothetical protein